MNDALNTAPGNPAGPHLESTMPVADTILAQLGGPRFRAMTGARMFVGGEDFLQFRIPTRRRPNGGGPVNTVHIQLDRGADLYNVSLYWIPRSAINCTKVASVEGVDVEGLREYFTRQTGLLLSL